MIKKISAEKIVLDKRFQGLCRKPYYNHSRGCPNFGVKKGCPPGLPLLDEIFDFEKEVYVIYTNFPIGKFAEKMRVNHPEWSEHPRQLYNPRRWQGTARKEHKQELEKFILENSRMEFNTMPEAHGVNCTELMKKFGIELNWLWPPPHKLDNVSYIISVCGIKK
jgi:predicted metal-binding protein